MDANEKKIIENVKAMTHCQKIAAIAWEAEKRGTSYGKLSVSLDASERERVYRSFCSFLEKKNAEDEKKYAAEIKAMGSRVPKNQKSESGDECRFRPEMVYSNENVGIREIKDLQKDTKFP